MRAFLKQVSTVSVVNVVNGVLGIVFVPVAVHRLGASGYGLFSIYTVLIAYMALSDLGIGTNLQRLLAGNRADDWRREQLRTVWGFYLILSAALLALLALLVHVVPTYLFPVAAESRRVVQWVTALAVLDFILGVPATLMQNTCIAAERFDRYARFNLSSGLVRYALMFGGVLLTRRPELLAAVITARRLVDLPLAFWATGGLPRGAWRPRLARAPLAQFVAGSSVLSLAQWLQITLIALAAMLVNWFFGLRALGVYRAAFDLVSKVWFFSNTIGLVLFPKFVRLFGDARQRVTLQRILPRLLSLSWIAYGALAIGGILVGPALLRAVGLSGADFGALFVILLAALTLNAHATSAYAFLLASGRARGGATRALLLGAVALALLVGTFFAARAAGAGLLAIGWAWVVSQLLYALLSDLSALAVLETPLRPARDLLARVVISSAVLSAVLVQLGGLPGAAGLGSVLLGGVALLLAGGADELRWIRAFTFERAVPSPHPESPTNA